MKKLLSLPANLVGCFHEVTGLSSQDYFVRAILQTANWAVGEAQRGSCSKPSETK